MALCLSINGLRLIMLSIPVAATVGNAQADTAIIALGKTLLEANCQRCHATGPEDSSSHPNAPAFRNLSSAYPIEFLAESLAEGILTGHPDMPVFEFEAKQVNGIIEYLKSIQSR